MITHLFKIIAALGVGALVGLLAGVCLGLAVGLVTVFFLEAIIQSGQITLACTMMGIALGGLLGWVATLLLNKIYEYDDRPWVGALVGAVIGFMVIEFIYGVIEPERLRVVSQAFASILLQYGSVLGVRTGALVGASFTVVAAMRQIIRTEAEARQGKEVK